MKRIIAGLSIALLCSSCATPEVFAKSEQAIADQGYTQINYEGYEWIACGEDDTFALRYSAIAPSGRSVTLAACSGYFKGVTIRTIN